MDKDKQIKFLLSALEELAGGYFFPWHGEDAINMKNYAKETIKNFKKKINNSHNKVLDLTTKNKLLDCSDDSYPAGSRYGIVKRKNLI